MTAPDDELARLERVIRKAWDEGTPIADAVLAAGWRRNPTGDAGLRARIEALPDVESVAAQVHEAWIATKRSQGVESRPSEWGEEQMVPYAALSERAKDLDRGTVKAVFAAMDALAADGGDQDTAHAPGTCAPSACKECWDAAPVPAPDQDG